MPERTAEATWQGKLQSGNGTVKIGSAFEGQYSFDSRFQQGKGTNPEDFIAAAHSSCFSMALAHGLEEAGYEPKRVHTVAHVSIDKAGDGFKITKINLETEASVPGIDKEVFEEQAKTAKVNCPVSKALAGAEINLKAVLV